VVAAVWSWGNIAYLLVGAVIGAIATLVANESWDRMRSGRERKKAKEEAGKEIQEARLLVDHRDLAFEIVTWSPSLDTEITDQLLRREDVGETRTADRPLTTWLTSPEAWQREYERALASHGRGAPTAYLVGFSPDNPETRSDVLARRPFQWTVAQGNYAEFLATSAYLAGSGKPDQNVLANRLRADWNATFAMSPPTIIACNISLVSADNKVLVLERSQSEATSRSLWTVGPHETMNWRDPANFRLGEELQETAFTLGHRTIKEEVGLEPDEYGRILFSWFGIWLRDASAYLLGHVRSRLVADEISVRIPRAQASYEIAMAGDQHEWVPYELDNFKDIALAAQTSRSDSKGRRRLELSSLSLRGLWTMRSMLLSHPDMYFERSFRDLKGYFSTD